MQKELLETIICPQSQVPLELKDGELYTDKTSYPIFNNIPWMFKNPEYSFLDWGTKISTYIAMETRTIKYLGILIQGEESQLTKIRLKRLQEAKSKNLQVFTDKLSPFLGHQQIKLIPSKQQIYSYFQLLFRDWAWETQENVEYFNFLKTNTTIKPKKILVLGAGACGLSHKLAQHFKEAQVIATDHNPFLFFMAEEIISGQKPSLTDYSFYPKNISSTTHQWELSGEPLKQNNHHMVLADYPHLPFKEESFDMIVAPWFFDILEENYQNSLYESLKFLKKDGELFQIGPANVHTRTIYEQLTSDEQISVLKDYFSAVLTEQKSIQYLKNPIESQQRSEEVLFVKALNKKETKTPFKKKKQTEFIKFTDELQEYKILNDTLHRVLKHIDGDITYEELSKKVQVEFGFKPEEAEYYTDTIMKKVLIDM